MNVINGVEHVERGYICTLARYKFQSHPMKLLTGSGQTKGRHILLTTHWLLSSATQNKLPL